MQITDSTIISIDKDALLKRETLLSLLDIQEPEERARLSALLELRAKEMGLQKEFKTVLKAYVQADEELAKEWKRANAKKRARIDLDFDGHSHSGYWCFLLPGNGRSRRRCRSCRCRAYHLNTARRRCRC